MNSEVVSGRSSGGRRSREHKRYLSIGDGSAVLEKSEQQQGSRRGSRIPFPQGRKKGGGDDDVDGDSGLRRADEKENLTGPRDMRVVFDGKVMKLSPTGKNSGGKGVIEKSPSGGSMYDRDGFLKELDAWLR